MVVSKVIFGFVLISSGKRDTVGHVVEPSCKHEEADKTRSIWKSLERIEIEVI